MKFYFEVILFSVIIILCNGHNTKGDEESSSNGMKGDEESSSNGIKSPKLQIFKENFTRELLLNNEKTKLQIRQRRAVPLRQVILDRIFGRRTTTSPTTTTTRRRGTPIGRIISDRFFGRRRTTTTVSTEDTTVSTEDTTVSTEDTTVSTEDTTVDSSTPSPSPSPPVSSNNPYFFSNRSGIVQLFEWKYLDIADECENYLGPKGFAGVQVSPPTENLIIPGRPWYERYQPISYQIKTRSGDETDFSEMTSRCNDVGIRIYVDVVLNHMAGNFSGTASGTAGNNANPNILYYPAVPYTKEDFHQPSCTMNNTNDVTIARNCELEGLHDLDHSKENVRWSIVLLLNRLIALGTTGFRIGAAKYMWPEDLKYIYDHINNLSTDFGHPNNSKPFIYQEVGDDWKFNYTQLGVVTEFNHPQNMADIFRLRKDVTMLQNYGTKEMGMLPSEFSLTFVDNHYLQRQNIDILTYREPKEFKAAYVFTLGYPYGIPRIMSSYDFDDNQQGPPADSNEDIISPIFDENGQCINGWICEHRWNAITNMIEFSNLVGNAPVRQWWSDGQGVFSFCRGNKGFIFINSGQRDYSGTIRTCLAKGVYCDVISGKLENGKCTGKTVTIDGNRKTKIELLQSDDEAAIVLHINAKESQ